MEAYIEWTDEEGTAHSLQLFDRIYIGRKCQGVPDDKKVIVLDAHVSKDHAVVTCSGSNITVYDMSRNGTYLNGSRVTSGVEQPIGDGDVIKVGNRELRVVVKEASELLGGAASPEETMTLSSQIVISNLVGDVRGYTTYSQKLDSALIYEAMKEIFDDFSVIVQKWRGVVKDYAGDAIFALWEHGPREDAQKAEEACRAAIEQARALDSIVRRIGEKHEGFQELQMGWAVTTGGATLSHYGMKKDYMAIVSDSTNLAFRLSKQANKNLDSVIVVCPRTARLLGDSLSLREIGEVATEGREGKEKVYGIDL